MKENMLRQKARVSLLKEGDLNTSFFHNVMKYCFRRNAIRFVNINDRRVERMEEVNATVRRHYEYNFRELNKNRPSLDGIQWRSLSLEVYQKLEEPFF